MTDINFQYLTVLILIADGFQLFIWEIYSG